MPGIENQSAAATFQMTTSYNQIAGQSVEHLAALSDGIFAVAMTLLVLDLHAPAAEAIHSEGDLRLALIVLAPRLLTYMMSCLTLGIFWVGQQTQLNHLCPQPYLDASRISLRRNPRALLRGSPGGTHRIPYRAFGLLVQHPVARGHPLLDLAMCDGTRASQTRHFAGSADRDPAQNRDRPISLGRWRGVVHCQSILEHRRHFAGATELRDRTASAGNEAGVIGAHHGQLMRGNGPRQGLLKAAREVVIAISAPMPTR